MAEAVPAEIYQSWCSERVSQFCHYRWKEMSPPIYVGITKKLDGLIIYRMLGVSFVHSLTMHRQNFHSMVIVIISPLMKLITNSHQIQSKAPENTNIMTCVKARIKMNYYTKLSINVLKVTSNEIENFHQWVLAFISHLRLVDGSHQTVHHSETATHQQQICVNKVQVKLQSSFYSLSQKSWC